MLRRIVVIAVFLALFGMIAQFAIRPKSVSPRGRSSQEDVRQDDPARIRVSVLVQDENAAPLISARVRLFSGDPAAELVTDPAGRCETVLRLPPTLVRVTFFHLGSDGREAVGVGESREFERHGLDWLVTVRVALSRDVAVVCSIVAETGTPLRGCRVRMTRLVNETEVGMPIESEPSDENGTALFKGMTPRGIYTVAVWSPRYFSDPERVSAAESPSYVRVVAREFPKVRGRVVDATGRPIPHAAVVFQVTVSASESTRAESVTDENGDFEFRITEDGDATISAIAPGLQTTSNKIGVVLIHGRSTSTVVSMASAAPGRLVRAQAVPPEGVSPKDVRIWLTKIVSDADDPEERVRIAVADGGEFSFELRRGDRYMLILQAPGCTSVTIRDLNSDTDIPKEFVLQRRK